MEYLGAFWNDLIIYYRWGGGFCSYFCDQQFNLIYQLNLDLDCSISGCCTHLHRWWIMNHACFHPSVILVNRNIPFQKIQKIPWSTLGRMVMSNVYGYTLSCLIHIQEEVDSWISNRDKEGTFKNIWICQEHWKDINLENHKFMPLKIWISTYLISDFIIIIMSNLKGKILNVPYPHIWFKIPEVCWSVFIFERKFCLIKIIFREP